MKTRILPIILLMSLFFGSLIQAQTNPNDDWESVEFPNIMFTECRISSTNISYFELTNMEDTAVDLTNFNVYSAYWDAYSQYSPDTKWYFNAFRGRISFNGDTIQAHETLVFGHILSEPDTTKVLVNNLKMVNKIDWPIFRGDSFGNPELLCENNPILLDYMNDTTFMNQVGTPNYHYMIRAGGQCQLHLRYNYDFYEPDTVNGGLDTTSTSITMDVINVRTEDFDTYSIPSSGGACAGVPGATSTHTLIRKTNGVQTSDWVNESKGISTEDSQWWVVLNATGTDVYSTVGVHGNYPISVSAVENTTAIVDDNALTITVPWEAVRGESVLDTYIDFGDGMAWTYIKDTVNSADSAYTRVRDGDLLDVYAFGVDVSTATYVFNVLDATDDLAIARTKVAQYPDGQYRTNNYFNITTEEPVMDSVLNIRYQLRVDTLFKYVEIPPLATSEIVHIDGDVDRIDLEDGDILRVTSADKSTVKDYYLKVADYNASTNTALSSITWPDYDRDYFFEWEFENGDTLPNFTPNKKNYTLTLPDYQTTVPALMASASDLNTKVKIQRATSLIGTMEQRTTTFTVYSEASDTILSEYTVVFDLDIEKQLTDAEPFFSAILLGRYNGDNYVEIVNPNNGSESLDLSRYLLVNAGVADDEVTAISNYRALATADGALATDEIVHKSYVPGYRFNYVTNGDADPTTWTWKDGVVGGITLDLNTTPFVAPSDVFVISAFNENSAIETIKFQGDSTYKFVDINLTANSDFPNLAQGNCVAHCQVYHRKAATTQSSLFLYRIENDSILDGSKGIWEDPSDYTVVDRVQWDQATEGTINGYPYLSNGTVLVRKPFVNKGVTEYNGGFYPNNSDTCEWEHYSRNRNAGDNKMANSALGNYIGLHIMNPITSHLSTVTSDIYAVDLGFTGDDLAIIGDMATQPVDSFIRNLNKADSLQTITVVKGVTPKDSSDLMESGDVVMVYSADSSNMTTYTIEARALSANTDIDAVADMGIVVDKGNLTISGFNYSKAIADVLAGVEVVDPLSIINVIDSTDNLVSLLTLSKDTSLTEQMVATLVYNGLVFEVVAEDGSIAKYTLTPDVASSDAYVTSNVFTVAEVDKRSISGVPNGYSVSTFSSYLFPSGNATLVLKNKVGAIRPDGLLQNDDYVEVTSEDTTTSATYAIHFYGENNPDNGPESISEQADATSFSVYPNPTSSVLNIENAQVGNVVQLISLGGSLVYSNVVTSENYTIDMSSMNNGIYLVRLVAKDKSTVVRVLKD